MEKVKTLTDGGHMEKEVYESLYRNVLSGQEDALLEKCGELLKAGYDPMEIIQNQLMPMMDDIGERVSRSQIFIPQILLSARMMQSMLNYLEPYTVHTNGLGSCGCVLIGTVKGDIHTIGKNMVGMMLQSVGCRVVDLGANVSGEAFVRGVRENGARVIALSALLTSSMSNMRSIVETLQGEDFGYPLHIIIGGGTVTSAFAKSLRVEYGINMMDTTQKVLRALKGIAPAVSP